MTGIRATLFTCALCLLTPLLAAAAGEEEARSRFSGVGMQLGPRVGVVEVGAVAVGGPADRAGIQPGDWITEIDGRVVRPEEIAEVVSRLRGATGTVVRVVVVTAAGTGRREAALVRATIDPAAVTWRGPGAPALPAPR